MDITTFKQDLLTKQASLVRNLEELGETIDLSVWERRDPADSGNAALEREQAGALNSSARERLRSVSIALRKIEVGKYGTCEDCREPIADARLEALPDTSFCVNCAAKNRR